MLKYVNVYGAPGGLLPNVFRALMQNSENIDALKTYESIGVVYISEECSTYDFQEKENLDVIGAFTYDVSTPRTGKIVAAEVFIGDIPYREVLEGITHQVEHLRLYEKGVPKEEHHGIITPQFVKGRVKTLERATRSRAHSIDLSGWTVSSFPVIKSRK